MLISGRPRTYQSKATGQNKSVRVLPRKRVSVQLKIPAPGHARDCHSAQNDVESLASAARRRRVWRPVTQMRTGDLAPLNFSNGADAMQDSPEAQAWRYGRLARRAYPPI